MSNTEAPPISEWERRIIHDLETGKLDHDPDGNLYETTTWAPADPSPALRGEVTIAPPAFLTRTDGRALIYPGRCHSFWGPSESLKSWAALAACKSVLEGGGTVLYLDFESDLISWVENCRTLGIPDRALGRSFLYTRPEEPLKVLGKYGADSGDMRARNDLSKVARELSPTLVIIDGVTEAMTLHGWHPYDPMDTAAYQHLLVRPWGPETAIIEIDHTGKDGKSGQLGSQQKKAGIDGASYEFSLIQSEGPGGHSASGIKVAKDRHGIVRHWADGHERVGIFHLDTRAEAQGPASWIAQPGTFKEVDAEGAAYVKVAEWLAGHPGSSTTAVSDGAKVGRTTALDTLKGMETDGVVTSTEGRKAGSREWTLI